VFREVPVRLSLSFLLLAACAVNPATGERQLSFVPDSQMQALGEQSAKQIVSSIGLVDNQGLQTYVSGIGKRLAAKSETPNDNWSFQVLDDTSVNAFALPGGYIFVTRGILAQLSSEAELAGVLGHEIGHVTAKHSADQMSKTVLAQLGLAVGGAVSDKFAKYGMPLASAGAQVLFLKYGRDDEYQSDELGVRYAGRAGYDVNQIPKVFEVLDRVTKQAQGGKSPEWLSTHPAPENRIERIREHIAKAEAKGTEVEAKRYLLQLDGLAYGADPRQGYFKEARFIHPTLGFEVTFPAGWKTANTAEAVAAQSPAEDAVVQLGVVDAASPEAALEAFLKKEGIEPGARGQGASSAFQLKTEKGTIAGNVAFLAHEGKTYGVLGITKPELAATYAPAFEAVRASFKPLTDPALRKAEPKRLEIVAAPRAMTLAELYKSRAVAVPLEEIAALNGGMQPTARLEAGQAVKLVRAGTQ
jgi:predicted Zn-dependent protease